MESSRARTKSIGWVACAFLLVLGVLGVVSRGARSGRALEPARSGSPERQPADERIFAMPFERADIATRAGTQSSPALERGEQSAPRVHGIVVDAEGQPVEGVIVEWRPDREGEPSVLTRRVWARSGRLYYETTSGSDGRFTFEESDAGRGGRLAYGFGLFEPTIPQAAVHRDGREHRLVLPAEDLSGPRLILEVHAREDGRPLYPELLSLEMLPHDDDEPARDTVLALSVDPRNIERTQGRAVVVGLAAGTWQVVLRSSHSEFGTVQVQMPSIGPDVLRHFELDASRGPWTVAGGSAKGGEPQRFSAAMEEYLPDHVPVRERGHVSPDDQWHYGETLQGIGPGALRDAVLELDIAFEGGQWVNENLGLEFAEESWFEVYVPLADLSPLAVPARRSRMFMDLSALRTDIRGSIEDVRRVLEDGELDLVVSGDATLHAVRLHWRY